MLYATILLWGLVFLLEPPTIPNPSANAWLGLLALGVVGSALPVMLMFLLVKRAGAEFVSLYGYILPLLGIVVAWIAFGRPPEMTFLVGMPITLAGVATVQWARRRGVSEPISEEPKQREP